MTKEEIINKNLFEILKTTPYYIVHLKEILKSPKEKKTAKITTILPSGESTEIEIITTSIFYQDSPALQLAIRRT